MQRVQSPNEVAGSNVHSEHSMSMSEQGKQVFLDSSK